MAATYRPKCNDQGVAKRRYVLLDTAVNAESGKMLVTVAGYGRVPAAANAATGEMAGIVVVPADNTLGAQGDLSAITEDGEYDFANSGTHPCSQADVGNTVYAASGDVISNDATDGPAAGTLVAYDPPDATVANRPCRVRLKTDNN